MFLPLPSNFKQTKPETMAFKRLDIRKKRTGTPERWKTSEVNPTIVPVYCLESFQAVVQGGKCRQSPVIAQLEDMQLDVQGSQSKWSL